MNSDCHCVVFTNKAYNAIMNESFRMSPNETGGILLGHILDNGYWIVMEVLPPGWRSIFQYAFFEYDTEFVNYLAKSVATEYNNELCLLGLWHRHPGSMDTFSGIDDGTNRTFASLNPKGAISGLVNIDPRFRLTMYHVSTPLHYTKVDVEIGDDLIPEEYFKLKYYDVEKGLNPFPPEKKNFSTNTEKQYETGSGGKNYIPKDSNIIMEIMRFFDSKYLFLLLFIVGSVFSLFAYYSYNKLKATDDIKSLYRVFYTEYTTALSFDTIKFVKNAASTDFDKKPQKIKLTKDSTYITNFETKISDFFVQNDITETFRAKGAKETAATYNAAKNEHLAKIKKNRDSIASVYDSVLINAELLTLKENFINEKVEKFLSDFKKSHELTPDIAKKGIKTVLVLLIIASLLSLLLAFLPRKHKNLVERLVIGVSAVVATLLVTLQYSLSPAFFVALFFVFAFLCFMAFVAIFILRSFNFKTGRKRGDFWYQQNQKLYLEEEAEIKKRFANAEKSVENGSVSFFINTYKKIAAEQDNLSFQLVYPTDYLTNKRIRIYLISPDLNELLGGEINDFPYIAIDSAGESYLDLSRALQKNQVSGMEVIRKFYEWIQQYQNWKSKRMNIMDIKL